MLAQPAASSPPTVSPDTRGSGAPSAFGAAPALFGRTVRDLRVKAPDEAFRGEAEREYVVGLMRLPPGRRLTRAALREGIEAVYRMGKWRGVAVEGAPVGDDGVALRLVLEPIERVGMVRFEGPRIVTRREMERVVDLRPGQEFRPEAIARATRAAQDYLDRLGYPDAVVVATSRPFGEPLEREVTLSLAPNEPCTLTAVRLSGDLGPGEGALREVLGVEAGDLCSRVAIGAGLERVRARLRERGYYEAVVREPRLEFGPERHTATLDLQVRAGPRTEVLFEIGRGAGVPPELVHCRKTGIGRRLSGRCREYGRLLAALGLGEQADLSDEGLSLLVDRLVAHFRTMGYAWTSASVRPEPLPDGRRLVFRVDPGPEMAVRGVEFRGNASISRDRLLDQMVTRKRSGLWGLLSTGVFEQGEFEEDLDAIRRLYQREGFLDVRLSDVDFRFSADRSDMWIAITIDEGRRYFVTGVDVLGADPVPPDVIRQGLPVKTGRPFSLADVDRAVEWLVQAMAGRGYLSARVVPDVALETDPPAARVRFTVTPGVQTLVGRIIYRGNFYTRNDVLAREMAVEPGDPYDPSRVLQSQRGIGRIGFLRNVSVRPADEAPLGAPAPAPDTSPAPAPAPPPPGPVSRDLVVSVEEANRVDLTFGFDYSLEERLRVFGDVTHRSLFGTDRSVTLRGLAGDQETFYGLEYRQPYLFGVRLNGRIGLVYQDREEENFSFRRSSVATGVQRDVHPTVRVSFSYELESTEVFDVDPGTILDPREDVGTIEIGALRPVVVWDLRDDPFNPTRGSLHTLSVEVANQVFASEVEFVRAVAGTSWHIPLERSRRVVLGVSLRGGYAVSYGASDEVPLIRRFFLGGATTVRGFDRDEISPHAPDGSLTGGNIYLNENVELRVPLPVGFGGAIFLDAGQVWLEPDDVDLGDERASVGAGLRYLTPIGPIRLDYGHKIDRKAGESRGRLHFSIGYVF